MSFYFGCYLLAGFVLWLNISYIDARPLMMTFLRWCGNLSPKCSMFSEKILNYMLLFVSSHRFWRSLVVALFMIFALSLTGCRAKKTLAQTSTTLTVRDISAPKVQTLASRWFVPSKTIEDLSPGDIPLTFVDNDAKIGVKILRPNFDSLVIEPFAFAPSPFSLGNLSFTSDAVARSPDIADERSTMVVVGCLFLFCAVFVFARKL